jgi:outer membrane cobalamin receptor
MLSKLCAVLLNLAAATSAQSEPTSAPGDSSAIADSALSRPPVVMPVYIVTAKRIESPTLDVPQSVATVPHRTIEDRQASGVAEALEDETGILVQETGNGMDSVFIRGLTGKQTLMLVDGVRLNTSTFRAGPNQYLNTVDEGLAERIELVRGPGSVLYGSDALGGVINVLSASPPGADARLVGGTLKLRAGSADGELSRVCVARGVRAHGAGTRGSPSRTSPTSKAGRTPACSRTPAIRRTRSTHAWTITPPTA